MTNVAEYDNLLKTGVLQGTGEKIAKGMVKPSEAAEFDRQFVFKTYGVTLRIESNDQRLLGLAEAIAKKVFLNRLTVIDDENAVIDYLFGIKRCRNENLQLFDNGEFRAENPIEPAFLRFFTSFLRVTVAERAVPWVFVHAGVVGHKGKTIVIPGNSYSGKTTLVAELVRQGAEYFSDEYAVFDENGLVHPFARDLSVRLNGDRLTPVEITVGDLQGKVSVHPSTVGFVLITEYVRDALWKSERLSIGNGIKEMIPHTVSIRFDTEFSLKVLNKALSRAIILKGLRPDAHDFAASLLSFMDNDLNWSTMTMA